MTVYPSNPTTSTIPTQVVPPPLRFFDRGTGRVWTAAPSARLAHPDEDHLIPLMVAVGAAEEDAGETVYHEDSFAGSLTVSSYRFGRGDG
jgi:hypothetical protein